MRWPSAIPLVADRQFRLAFSLIWIDGLGAADPQPLRVLKELDIPSLVGGFQLVVGRLLFYLQLLETSQAALLYVAAGACRDLARPGHGRLLLDADHRRRIRGRDGGQPCFVLIDCLGQVALAGVASAQ